MQGMWKLHCGISIIGIMFSPDRKGSRHNTIIIIKLLCYLPGGNAIKQSRLYLVKIGRGKYYSSTFRVK